MRSDSPKCICAPNCKRHDGLWPKGGPVCGTDGVSYKSHCRLKKRSCRTRDQSLTVNYRGPCQSECIKYATYNKSWTNTPPGRKAGGRVGPAGCAYDGRNAPVRSGREPNLTFFFVIFFFFADQAIALLPSNFRHSLRVILLELHSRPPARNLFLPSS